MINEFLYPVDDSQVHRCSSIDQFEDYIHTYKQGGACPIIFDQLDYIGECSGVHSHPVAITFGENEYVYPEGRCVYTSDRFIYTDKAGVEHRLLPECMGGKGEFYETFVRSNSFTNFDDDTALGVHTKTTLRVGLSMVRAEESLPSVD